MNVSWIFHPMCSIMTNTNGLALLYWIDSRVCLYKENTTLTHQDMFEVVVPIPLWHCTCCVGCNPGCHWWRVCLHSKCLLCLHTPGLWLPWIHWKLGEGRSTAQLESVYVIKVWLSWTLGFVGCNGIWSYGTFSNWQEVKTSLKLNT